MSEPVVADSIFCVREVDTSTGLPMTLGSAGISRAALPAGIILSCRWPCVSCDAMLYVCVLGYACISSSYCYRRSAPARAGSSRVAGQVEIEGAQSGLSGRWSFGDGQGCRDVCIVCGV